MDYDLGYIYKKVCSKNNKPVNEFILSCMSNASIYGEFNLRSATVSETSCLLIAQTLKQAPAVVTALDLSECLLPSDGLEVLINIINCLENTTRLNLKGNQIGRKITRCISKMMMSNTTLTELQLEWNNIGDSEDAFSELCNSLMCNTVLITLNLASNNLDYCCVLHLANILPINKSLRHIDLNWNSICDEGALCLLKSLEKNQTLLSINIQGNAVTVETSHKIANQLNQNKSIGINKKNIEMKNLCIIEHVASVDKNHQLQLKQYQIRIDDLEKKLSVLQKQCQNQLNELEDLKKKNVKEKEISYEKENEIQKLKFKLSDDKQNLNFIIKKNSMELSDTELERINTFEDMEKINYIIKNIKKKSANKLLKESKIRNEISEALPKFNNELNSIKTEINAMKLTMKNEVNKFDDKLSATQCINLTNLTHLRELEQMNKELHLKYMMEQQNELKTSEAQKKMLVSLNKELQTLNNEKIDCELKLAESKQQIFVSEQTLRSLENSLILANDALKKSNEIQLSSLSENSNTKQQVNSLTEEVSVLKSHLFAKDHQIKLYEEDKKMYVGSCEAKILNLQTQLQTSKQQFEEKKKEDLKELKELYVSFSEYYQKVNGSNLQY